MKDIVDILDNFAEYLNDHHQEISEDRSRFYGMYNDMLSEINKIRPMTIQEIKYVKYVRENIQKRIWNPTDYNQCDYTSDLSFEIKTRIKNTEIDPFDEEVWYEEDFIKK